MSDNVVRLTIVPKAEKPVTPHEEPLPIAASVTVNGEKLDLTQLITIGVTAEGTHYFNCSDMPLAEIVLLLEQTKLFLMEQKDD